MPERVWSLDVDNATSLSAGVPPLHLGWRLVRKKKKNIYRIHAFSQKSFKLLVSGLESQRIITIKAIWFVRKGRRKAGAEQLRMISQWIAQECKHIKRETQTFIFAVFGQGFAPPPPHLALQKIGPR